MNDSTVKEDEDGKSKEVGELQAEESPIASKAIQNTKETNDSLEHTPSQFDPGNQQGISDSKQDNVSIIAGKDQTDVTETIKDEEEQHKGLQNESVSSVSEGRIEDVLLSKEESKVDPDPSSTTQSVVKASEEDLGKSISQDNLEENKSNERIEQSEKATEEKESAGEKEDGAKEKEEEAHEKEEEVKVKEERFEDVKKGDSADKELVGGLLNDNIDTSRGPKEGTPDVKTDAAGTNLAEQASLGGWTKEERDLPAPPPPIKEKETVLQESNDDDEMSKVARAFGVSTKLEDSPAIEKDDIQSSSATESTDEAMLNAPSGSQVTTSTPHTPAKKSSGIHIGKGPPPTTPASEEKPFDFNRFLDQMRHRSAGPVGEYVRSFIKGFTKKPYRVSDQTKLILDFLDFISLRMRECEVWSNVSTTEFENATEAMEKLIMNRLYNYTFSPAIKKEGKWSVQTDDLERDRVLKQRIRLFGWIDESHLDVPVGDHSKGFIDFAIQELLKINHYKAPRDKVICILNCCKVIFGLIRHLSTQENADNFVPILIFVVLRANPDNLISNVEYISRFRNPEKLSSESGYYLSSLMGAVAFIETMDYTSLSNITQQEFETNVEEAVQHMSTQPESADPFTPVKFDLGKEVDAHDSSENGESSSAPASMQLTPQGSSLGSDDPNRALPISAGAAALAKDTKAFIQRTGEAARMGIGASFGGSMNALGRLFQDGLDGPRSSSSPSSGVVSGRDTPELGVGPGSGNATSARARMWNLFGADEDPEAQLQRQRQQEQQQQWQQKQLGKSSVPSTNAEATDYGTATRSTNKRNVSTPSLNFSSWSRAIRTDIDSEPPTPQSEELRQGRFAPLSVPGQSNTNSSQNAPLSERLARSFETKTPLTPNMVRPPLRQGSTDPYLLDGAGGVRTPTDDGSDVGDNHLTPQHLLSSNEQQKQQQSNLNTSTNITRSRVSDLSSYLPSFLSEANVLRTPQTQASALPNTSNENPNNLSIDQEYYQSQHQRLRELQQHSPTSPSPTGYRQEDERIAEAAAQIDRAHLNAGVETLKSIFPDTDNSVCRLVLEGCDGNVQQAIDKLLEMS